ncbi:GDP-mannose-dependent alpha-mannosyltransferase [Planctomycetes bacterium Pan216]|uniref:GDP-mannose-dependent alpha-mannosyltransferase n=1 Tax=Kolteria novifilia TaxID=2527975 RepID=A0A518B8Q3_9BACT|nr:GDP-mannose-dependent alpha-mannosyltransferase [Planctomycetes bacterium Pan216]
MRITMFTNVYRPKIGGITRSIDAFASQFRSNGHVVQIVAPTFEGSTAQDEEPDVFRIPSLHDIVDGYSLPIPLSARLQDAVTEFAPEVIHAHHPFLLGSTAHKIAALLNVPIVYTHHTRFDAYQALFEEEGSFLQHFAVALSTNFAALCDAVVAPGEFVRHCLQEAGVQTRIEVIPTGVDTERFSKGDGAAARRQLDLAPDVPVAGTISRLSPEKNLGFLTQAASRLLQQDPRVHFLLVGTGPEQVAILDHFGEAGIIDRVRAPGLLEGQDLVDAYAVLDVFMFSSKSETQGMVVTEAMASGVPVVALRASGVEDVLEHGKQGTLLDDEDDKCFANATADLLFCGAERKEAMKRACRETAEQWSIQRCAQRMLSLYEELAEKRSAEIEPTTDVAEAWNAFGRRLHDEFVMFSNVSQSVRDAFVESVFE